MPLPPLRNAYPKSTWKDTLAVGVIAVLCVGLYYCDWGPEYPREAGTKERARVLSVDNRDLMQLGLLTQGSQNLEVEILSGEYRGEVFAATNQLRAQMELDKIFVPGDTILVGIYEGAEPGKSTLNAQDYYRLGWIWLLFSIFAILLILFGGITGFKALLSFLFSCMILWKGLVPLALQGWNPMFLALGIVFLLSAVIIFLVAGFNRKGVTAFSGTILGISASCLMAWIFTHLFQVNGAVMPFSQALLYSGFESLNLVEIFIGGIFIGSSGAVMDLGMDVAAGMTEVAAENRQISRGNLILAGWRIGQSVVGTMTTTLLLAYSGGYLTLMMAFTAQGITPTDFLNSPYVASEVVKTLVGSFGLVLVAPFTALAGGFFLLPPR